MAYIHDSAPRHAKVRPLSDRAFRVWVALQCYCNEHLTDGRVTKQALRTHDFGVKVTTRSIEELLQIQPYFESGLLEDRGDYYQVHDFLDWNRSKAQVQETRRHTRSRVADLRARKALAQQPGNGVTPTNGNAVRNAVTATPVTPVTGTGEEDHVQRTTYTAPGGAEFSTPCGNPSAPDWRFYRALAFKVIDAYPHERDAAELEELLKTAVARTGNPYNSEVIREALEAALAQRRRALQEVAVR